MRELRDRGVAIFIVTHRIAELVRISDKATVMRDGKDVGVLGLVSICILGTYIGFKLFDILPTHLIAIPVFIMPLYITILMLKATDVFYRVAVVSGGILGPILFPYIGDWSIIISGFIGATFGLFAHKIQTTNK